MTIWCEIDGVADGILGRLAVGEDRLVHPGCRAGLPKPKRRDLGRLLVAGPSSCVLNYAGRSVLLVGLSCIGS